MNPAEKPAQFRRRPPARPAPAHTPTGSSGPGPWPAAAATHPSSPGPAGRHGARPRASGSPQHSVKRNSSVSVHTVDFAPNSYIEWIRYFTFLKFASENGGKSL